MSAAGPKARKASSGVQQDGKGARARARLAAVQALYQMELAGVPVAQVAREFIEHRFASQDQPVDAAFFSDLVRGVVEHQVVVDRGLAEVLVEGWSLERLDSTLRALLRAGAYELRFRPDVPPRVVLNEYVEIAHAFFSGQERAFANGVLDRVARVARPGAFDDRLPPESPT